MRVCVSVSEFIFLYKKAKRMQTLNAGETVLLHTSQTFFSLANTYACFTDNAGETFDYE